MMSDRERLEEIYEAYSGLILAYAVRRTRDPEDAADVVAETFAVAWRRIDDVPQGENARPWLYGVARRVLANQRRSHLRRGRLEERIAGDVAALVRDADVGDGPDARVIADAFSRLSDRDRELLTLVAWEGLDRDDIAQVLGCSRATVRVRLHRARVRFERHLGEVGVRRWSTERHDVRGWTCSHPDAEEA